ncbi:response regulator transcription factor [Kitasatospora sp. NPDC059327]|uniref:response regulator transcription factor n=1 Tax=Kitasatospora sp. NPDC059327 TaxID=3346803 RepID=UPI0036A8644D
MHVLVVDDERELADMIAEGLRGEGMDADTAYDGARALELAATRPVDVMVLDRDLPVLSGDAVCRSLRAQGSPVRVLMLTAAGTVADLVDGFALGADDYLAKPFSYLELVSRVQALGRRGGSGAPTVLERHGVRLDTTRRIVERDGRPLRLTLKEYGVLEALLAADGGVVSPQALIEQVWDPHQPPSGTAVKVTVHQLRRKLGDPPLIETVPKFGYRL